MRRLSVVASALVCGCGLAAGLGDYRVGETTADGGDATTSSTSGGMAGVGGEDTRACDVAADCADPDVACRVPACVEGACVLANAEAETACAYAGGDVCDGGGNCVKNDGKACSVDSECASTMCVDDVCCETLCDSPCNDCALEESVGICSPVAPAVTDPACGVGTCDGAGTCAGGGARWGLGFGDGDHQFVGDITADADGNVYIVGDTIGMTGFGGSVFASDDRDAYLAKFSADGLHIFSTVWDNVGIERATSVAIDPSDGSMVIAGEYDGAQVDFGAGALINNAGGLSMFVLRLDANGTPQWQVGFAETQSGDQTVSDIAIDASGNVWLTGYMRGEINFGNGASSANLNNRNIFVAQVSAVGIPQFGRVWGATTTVDMEGRGIAIDPMGHPIIVGHMRGTVDFGLGPQTVVGPVNNRDVVVVKLTPDGMTTMWAANFGGTQGGQTASSVDTDSEGNIIVGGEFSDHLDFRSPMVDVLFSSGNNDDDAFVAKLDAGGQAQWAQDFGAADDEDVSSVAVTPRDTVVATVEFFGPFAFNGATFMNADDPNREDVAVLKLAADGTHLWGRYFGDGEIQWVTGAVVADSGNIAFGGAHLGQIDIGATMLPTAGGFDIYLGCLQP